MNSIAGLGTWNAVIGVPTRSARIPTLPTLDRGASRARPYCPRRDSTCRRDRPSEMAAGCETRHCLVAQVPIGGGSGAPACPCEMWMGRQGAKPRASRERGVVRHGNRAGSRRGATARWHDDALQRDDSACVPVTRTNLPRQRRATPRDDPPPQSRSSAATGVVVVNEGCADALAIRRRGCGGGREGRSHRRRAPRVRRRRGSPPALRQRGSIRSSRPSRGS